MIERTNHKWRSDAAPCRTKVNGVAVTIPNYDPYDFARALKRRKEKRAGESRTERLKRAESNLKKVGY